MAKTLKNALPVPPASTPPLLTAAAFLVLADVPPELEWFANLGTAATRRSYQTAGFPLLETTQCRRLRTT